MTTALANSLSTALAEFFHLAHWPSGGHNGPQLSLGEGNRTNGSNHSPDHDDEEQRFERSRTGGESYHKSVLLEEVTFCLEPEPGKLFLDGTLGGGGHTEQLLKCGAKVIGLDQDPAALSFARARLSEHEDNFGAIQGNFSEFGDILETIGIKGLDGILLDLGVSSRQLDDADRGFSFQKDGPLDMRMDNSKSDRTAADLVNEESEQELARIFFEYGEERMSRKIARAIVNDRQEAPFVTTLQLASLIERIVRRGNKKSHPATRVFQALRIAVNDELRALERALNETPRWLRPGGRLAVITFHSLEDRIVKSFLKRRSTEMIDRPEWPEPRKNPDHSFRLVMNKALAPSEQEIASNPRARSAKLRVAERI